MPRFLPALIAVVLVIGSCSKEPPVQVTPEQTVTKNVVFEVYAGQDYSNPFYDNALAEIKLSLATMNLRNNTITIIWDTAYDFRQLKTYPQIDRKFRIEKSASHLENSELLHVSKTVRYNVNGSMSMEASGEGVSSTSKLVTVSL